MTQKEIDNIRNGIDKAVSEKEKAMWKIHRRLDEPFDYTRKALDLFIEAGNLASEIIKLREAQLLIENPKVI